jgi:hypothetical protein
VFLSSRESCEVFHTCAALHRVSGNLVQPFAKNFAQFVMRITLRVRLSRHVGLVESTGRDNGYSQPLPHTPRRLA